VGRGIDPEHVQQRLHRGPESPHRRMPTRLASSAYDSTRT
jgi:hypothetical protein